MGEIYIDMMPYYTKEPLRQKLCDGSDRMLVYTGKIWIERQVRELLRRQREAIAKECDERWASSGDQIATYLRSLPDEL